VISVPGDEAKLKDLVEVEGVQDSYFRIAKDCCRCRGHKVLRSESGLPTECTAFERRRISFKNSLTLTFPHAIMPLPRDDRSNRLLVESAE
jgi:hypothetical protein